MNPEHAMETAEALLAIARHRLTGKEIEACEWTQSDEFLDLIETGEISGPDEPDKDDFEDLKSYAEAYELWELTEDKWQTLKRLRLEFYAAITRWIDAKDREASRRAVKTHNRLQTNHHSNAA